MGNNATTLDSGISSGLVYANWFTLGNFVNNAGNFQSLGSQKEVQSIFAAATLGYKNYLYLDVTGRNDWSSTLPDGNNSYFYPSVTLSSVLTDLFNMESNKTLSFAKVRVGWASNRRERVSYSRANWLKGLSRGIITPSIIKKYKDAS